MKYKIQITRIGYAFHNVEIEAEDDISAENKADELAGDILYSESSSEYNFEILEIED